MRGLAEIPSSKMTSDSVPVYFMGSGSRAAKQEYSSLLAESKCYRLLGGVVFPVAIMPPPALVIFLLIV